MYDIITFGSAVRDAFFYSSNFKVFKNKSFTAGQGLGFNLGSKIEIDKVIFTTGGGGTNTAVSFSKLGFNTACIVQVGDDVSGREVINGLKKEKVKTDFLLINKKLNTAYSVILSAGNKGRTILIYRGASSYISPENISWSKIKSKWFYIASLNGNFSLLDRIFQNAKKNKTKIAFNPGSEELKRPQKLIPLLKKADILILNQEEASILTKISFNKLSPILKKIDSLTPGIGVITKGARGVAVILNGKIYQAKTLEAKAIEQTGAGDAFGSGFVSGMILKNNIEYAIQLGSANATSVIQKIGAKNGLLSKKDLNNFKKVKVSVN